VTPQKMADPGAAFRNCSAQIFEYLTGVADDAAAADDRMQLQVSTVQQAARLGLFLPHISINVDRPAWDALSVGLLHEAVGRTCTGLRSLLTVQGIVGSAIDRFGNADQRRLLLPAIANGKIAAICISEEGAGSDMKAIEAIGRRDGDDIIIDGKKKWVTFGSSAELLVVMVQMTKGPTSVLVESTDPGVKITPKKNMLGLRSAHVADITLENVRVPAGNLLGPEGGGLFTVANVGLDFGRYSIAWAAAGMAAACLHDAAEYAKRRTVKGRPIRDFQMIRRHIGLMVVGLRQFQEFLRSLALARDDGSVVASMETSLAKFAGAQLAMDCASCAVQIIGAPATEGGVRVERFFRDAKILEIIEGTSEVHLDALADHAFVSARQLT
jgi:glutaryl-CoA dehydrogenase (non-decarboxylating)